MKKRYCFVCLVVVFWPPKHHHRRQHQQQQQRQQHHTLDNKEKINFICIEATTTTTTTKALFRTCVPCLLTFGQDSMQRVLCAELTVNRACRPQVAES